MEGRTPDATIIDLYSVFLISRKTGKPHALRPYRFIINAVQRRRKSYADNRRRELEFEVGNKVFLRIAPMKGVMRFGKKGKLSPRYIGAFEILDRVGPVAYRVTLPPSLAGVHNVFHVSMLRKYVLDPSHIIDYEPLQIQEDMTYAEEPVRILEKKAHVL
ncbi:uncharacterized protein LOC122296712 [Carya illinoinensis]|uniref:uncharacterized protein LOC122296712 n=1 Tax=Carya illinoinensis TaxID=32201 RepID=UPI001C7230A6|nr:uncharacterized protein LOC122296712 [Carya illinoinensis]